MTLDEAEEEKSFCLLFWVISLRNVSEKSLIGCDSFLNLFEFIILSRLFARASCCQSSHSAGRKPQMANEQTFRASLSQFRWARGVTDDSQAQAQAQAQQPAQSNPFSRFYNAVAGDYIPLRSNDRNNQDDAWLALSRWERLLGFVACLVGAAICFAVAFITLPLLAFKPAKFALSFRFVISFRLPDSSHPIAPTA